MLSIFNVSGDRRATETRNLSQFNVENKYGREALKTVMEKILIINYVSLTGKESTEEKARHETFIKINGALKGVGIEGPVSDVNIPKFLNRILGLPVKLQNYLFDYFMETVESCIEKAKEAGRFDLGIMGMWMNNWQFCRFLFFIFRLKFASFLLLFFLLVLRFGKYRKCRETAILSILAREYYRRCTHWYHNGCIATWYYLGRCIEKVCFQNNKFLR